jgi:bifunctional non-homologous end joining protein LigD
MSGDILRAVDPRDAEPIIAIQSLDGLLALVQSSVLEIHPWGSTLDKIEQPDRMIFDLDPGEDIDWSMIVVAAQDIGERLRLAGLESFVKTTGGKGLHVVAPLTPTSNWTEVKDFTHRLARAMTNDQPQRYTATMAKRERGGRIFIDYLRNSRGATAVAAYSSRTRKEAGVSTPLCWDELKTTISATQFTLLNIETRLSHLKSDPWGDIAKLRQQLPPSSHSI